MPATSTRVPPGLRAYATNVSASLQVRGQAVTISTEEMAIVRESYAEALPCTAAAAAIRFRRSVEAVMPTFYAA